MNKNVFYWMKSYDNTVVLGSSTFSSVYFHDWEIPIYHAQLLGRKSIGIKIIIIMTIILAGVFFFLRGRAMCQQIKCPSQISTGKYQTKINEPSQIQKQELRSKRIYCQCCSIWLRNHPTNWTVRVVEAATTGLKGTMPGTDQHQLTYITCPVGPQKHVYSKNIHTAMFCN